MIVAFITEMVILFKHVIIIIVIIIIIIIIIIISITRAVADAGGRPGRPGPPLFLDQTEARRFEKTCWRPPTPIIYVSECPHLPPPLISRSGSGIEECSFNSTFICFGSSVLFFSTVEMNGGTACLLNA